jgi:hypothetical protein
MKTFFRRKTVSFLLIIIWLMLALNYRVVLAFQDIYEPDETAEQANRILVDDDTLQQHTLHSGEDEDWFKFYGAEGIQYDLLVETVGADINVVLEFYDSDGVTKLERSDDDGKGEKEALSWRTKSEGWYFAKISDKLNNSATSENCRRDIQYQLRLTRSDAPDFDGEVRGKVIDAVSGQPIKDAIVSNSCNKYSPEFSFEDGSYSLISEDGLCELTAKKAPDYKPLTCHVAIPPIFSIVRNFRLWPTAQNVPAPSPSQIAFRNGDTLRPSQPVYRNGDNLKVEFDLHELPSYICARYYAGIAYPDGRFFIITQLNQFEPFDWVFLPLWAGSGFVVIDKSVDDNWPRGDYQLYLLRMPTALEDPINHLDKGELNVGQFRIE